MKRLALLVIFAAACGSSGPGTGMVSITGVTPTPKSASATPFANTGSGGNTIGWRIDFIEGGAGTDCMDQNNNIVATIGIYTNVVDDGSHKPPILDGEIQIVSMSPPTVTGNAAANMSAMGVSGVLGTITVTDAYTDHINGTLNAAGTMGGTAVSITGDFKAPQCGGL